jgi:hypothetical protein
METKEMFELTREEVTKRIKHLEEYIADQEKGPDSDQEKRFYHWENIPNARIKIADLEKQHKLMKRMEKVCVATDFNILLNTVKLLSSIKILLTQREVEDPRITTVGTWWIKEEVLYYEKLLNKAKDLLSRAEKKEVLIKEIKTI